MTQLSRIILNSFYVCVSYFMAKLLQCRRTAGVLNPSKIYHFTTIYASGGKMVNKFQIYKCTSAS
jgi:hypothetical protein